MRHRFNVAGYTVALQTEQLMLLPWLKMQFRHQLDGTTGFKARLQYDLVETLSLLVTCGDKPSVSLGIIGALQTLPQWIFDPTYPRRNEVAYAQAEAFVLGGPERLVRWTPMTQDPRWVCQLCRVWVPGNDKPDNAAVPPVHLYHDWLDGAISACRRCGLSRFTLQKDSCIACTHHVWVPMDSEPSVIT